jgi:hypothetical protein
MNSLIAILIGFFVGFIAARYLKFSEMKQDFKNLKEKNGINR